MKLKSNVRHFLLVAYYFFGRRASASMREGPLTRVLVFHHLDKPRRFDKLICKLKKDYNFISFDSYLTGGTKNDRVNLILAFDDGYKSWAVSGAPIFSKHGLKPLFFVNSDYVDLAGADGYDYCRDNINTWAEESITWRELRRLKELGGSVGGHTKGHTDLTDAKNKSIISSCVALDKQNIDAHLGQDTQIFAYPYGRWDKGSVKVVANAGYKYAFTSDSGYLEDSVSDLRLLRTNVGMRTYFVARAYIEGCAEILTSDIAKLRSLIRAA